MRKIFILGGLMLFLAGCETTAPPFKIAPAKLQSVVSAQTMKLHVAPQDVIHVVAPGETVWRIGKMYDVNIEDIKKANHLSHLDQLKMGQKLIIPGASKLRSVVLVYPSQKWKKIIIHHSATDEGSSLAFNESHLKRGWSGVGYHFIIDNGTRGKTDGQIEVSPRWIKQLDGAHCKASNMNTCSIGICLVGNFSEEQVTEKQMASLVYLTNLLRNYYHISEENILGHGQVPGAQTECPGKRFPWQRFRSALEKS